ncbi:MAG: HD domain-containing protein [Spirochaetales bacterium]|nr:HD domain-containing protein [Spirochaetales bacterium]
MDTLKTKIDFIIEIDKIKKIFRQTRLFDNSRHENDAEHSWHLAVMTIVLADYADRSIDVLKTVKMVLIHDLVEIDAGDTFLYDKNKQDKKNKELKAAERIFGMLPEETGSEFHALWQEFEERETPEAQFAAALDRMEPLMQNCLTNGFAWKKHGIKVHQVKEANRHIENGSRELWNFAQKMIDDAVKKGYLEK